MSKSYLIGIIITISLFKLNSSQSTPLSSGNYYQADSVYIKWNDYQNVTQFNITIPSSSKNSLIKLINLKNLKL